MAGARGAVQALSIPILDQENYGLSSFAAVGLCGVLALVYVLILYLPPLILHLPPPRSFEEHLLRRFAFAFFASVLSPLVCSSTLPLQGRWKTDFDAKLSIFGIRSDHLGQALLYPLLLTIILYLGPLVVAAFALFSETPQEKWKGASRGLGTFLRYIVHEARSSVTDVMSWRLYVLAPMSEELVFRACMTPILLCGGFSTSAVILICPLFFSVAHVHHFGEMVYQQHYTKREAAVITAAQLLYTTIFGWYATFLYLRTGHLVAPLVAHIFCNFMGAPDWAGGLSSKNKVVPLSFIAGLICFYLLLGPATAPALYNSTLRDCGCWLGYCRYSTSDV